MPLSAPSTPDSSSRRSDIPAAVNHGRRGGGQRTPEHTLALDSVQQGRERASTELSYKSTVVLGTAVQAYGHKDSTRTSRTPIAAADTVDTALDTLGISQAMDVLNSHKENVRLVRAEEWLGSSTTPFDTSSSGLPRGYEAEVVNTTRREVNEAYGNSAPPNPTYSNVTASLEQLSLKHPHQVQGDTTNSLDEEARRSWKNDFPPLVQGIRRNHETSIRAAVDSSANANANSSGNGVEERERGRKLERVQTKSLRKTEGASPDGASPVMILYWDEVDPDSERSE